MSLFIISVIITILSLLQNKGEPKFPSDMKYKFGIGLEHIPFSHIYRCLWMNFACDVDRIGFHAIYAFRFVSSYAMTCAVMMNAGSMIFCHPVN